MSSHNPLLIYSTARCGSTSLTRALNCHPDVRLAFEPFNKRWTPFEEELPIRWPWKFDRLVKTVLTDHSGLKHVWDPTGWPLGRFLNRRLLTRRWAMIVFLRRHNLLRQAVSNFMGIQSRVFHPEDREKGGAEAPEYEEIGIPGLKRFIAGSLRERDAALGWLKRSGNPYVELWYEDLFGEALNREDRHRVLEELMNRMGLSLDAEGVDLERVATLLDPVSTKMNSRETYRAIPNVDEIEAELGSDSTGWLFSDSE